MEVGKQIQRYRKEKNLSQDELADKIFVSRQSISNWERDVTYPDIQNLLLLSQIFDISVDTLIKGDIQTMKKIIHQTDYKQYDTDTKLFVIFLLLSMTVTIPLILYLEWYGAILSFSSGQSVRFMLIKLNVLRTSTTLELIESLWLMMKEKAYQRLNKSAKMLKPLIKKWLLF